MITTPPLNPTWSAYFNDPSPDSILFHTTSDGLLLSLPRFILQAASHVFEDLLTIPQPPSDSPSKPYDAQNAPGILPEVRLQDVKGSDLEWALRLAHRDHVEQATKELRGESRYWNIRNCRPVEEVKLVEEILRILLLADKFALHGIKPILLDTLGQPKGPLLQYDFLQILVVAIIFHDRDLASLAFDSWDEEEKDIIRREFDEADGTEVFATFSIQHTMEGYGRNMTDEEERWTVEPEPKMIRRWRPRHVSDLDEEMLAWIPTDALLLLLKAETVVTHSVRCSWMDGKDFFICNWYKLGSFKSRIP